YWRPTASGPRGARRRLPSPRSGAPPATPGWWSARSGQAPRHRAVLVGSWRDRRAPPEEAAPRAGVARPAAGSGARRRVVDPPGSPPRGPRGGADDREARGSRAWSGRLAPSDGRDAPGRTAARSQESVSPGRGDGAPAGGPA